MTRQLLKSHRTMGFEVARTRANDGREFVILQTAPHKEEAALAHTLMPVAPQDFIFEVRILLTETIEHARFLGLDAETIRALVDEELNRL